MGYKDLSGKHASKGRPIVASIAKLPITVQFGNTQRHMKLGKIKRITMHWSVGPYTMAFDDYHVNILFDEATGEAHVIKTLKYSEMGRHAAQANTGNIGIGFAAMMKTNTSTGEGRYPITGRMLAVAAQFVAEFCCWHNLDPRTDALTDHKRVDIEVGRKSKIDIGLYFEPFKADVIARYDALKAGKLKFQYRGILTD